MTRIAFIGLGNMGSRWSKHLIAAGHAVRRLTWPAPRSRRARPCPGRRGHAPSPATRARRRSHLHQRTSTALRGGRAAGAAASSTARPVAKPGGAVCIDHKHISAVATRRIAAELEAAGLDFLDSPGVGRHPGRAEATLSINGRAARPKCSSVRAPCCSCGHHHHRTSAATARARSPRLQPDCAGDQHPASAEAHAVRAPPRAPRIRSARCWRPSGRLRGQPHAGY
ncbi:hypothetical protein RSP824_04840 [Ralstonia pseudosolanacearum]|uniref:6-phosphogluconate dehydrogenase NADP-binding domain-containing protein n=1 Tax=Ralstonia solanacearum TaxID=305 RepID=A0AA86I8K5_RALSL|nr:hypothetical protein RSP824_04840 [Ralstonia pseudosolanacearum]